jgi:hypothetical protein
MAGENTLTTAQGWTKKIYDNVIKDLRSKNSILQKKIGFDGGTKKIGDTFQVSVTLRYPNGWTYLGSTGDASTTLKDARPQVNLQAAVGAFNSMLQERVVYAALLRIAEEGEGAFCNLASEIMKGMKISASNRVEMNMLGGQRSLGTIEAVTDLGTQQMDLTISEATWRPGLFWAVGEGATFDTHSGTATKNNTAGALILAGIKQSERKITVTHTATFSDEAAIGNELYFEGAYGGTTVWNEAAGLYAQAWNLTGTSMGISATTYSNWKGNRYNVNGNISFDVVEDAIGQLRDRGADGKLEFYVANKGFGRLMQEPKVNRSFDSSYSPEKAKQGHKSMSYFSADVGEVEIINHSFLAQEEFLIINPDDACRVGSTDMEFGVPNTGQGQPDYWFPISNTPYAGIHLSVDQASLLKRPPAAMAGYGITFT